MEKLLDVVEIKLCDKMSLKHVAIQRFSSSKILLPTKIVLWLFKLLMEHLNNPI